MSYITADLHSPPIALRVNATSRITLSAGPARALARKNAQYFPALTGLRFVLGLWVILHHLTGRNMLLEPWSRSLPTGLQSILRGGYLAVQSFFLLSGFVLAQSYASTRWNRQSLKRFAVARFARIYPVYLLSLLIVSWFAYEFSLKPGQSASRKAAVLGSYAFLLQGWTGSSPVGWNTPAWSLSCELFFYACFPLLFLALRRASRMKLIAALGLSFITPIVLAHAGVPDTWKPIHHLSDFLAGIAAAGIYNSAERKGVRIAGRGAWLYIPAALAGAALIIHPQVLDGTLMNLNTILRPLNVALLIGLAMGGGLVARALSSAAAGYLGKASYSMYILHIPLLWWYSQYTSYRYGAAPPAWAGFLYISLVTVLSMAAFKFVEVPANRWIRDWAAATKPASRPVVLQAAA